MSSLRDVTPILPDGELYILSYNGFTFDPGATETLGVQCIPRQDEAGRTTAYVDISITVKSVVYVSSADEEEGFYTTDEDFNSIRRRLTSQGGQLIYQRKGFGDLSINTGDAPADGSNPKWDVAWGPTPKMLSAKPVADNKAWEFVWTVSTCIPECSAANYISEVIAFNYEVTYANDYAGYQTRTVDGYIEIPLTRPAQNVRTLTKTVDEYRDKIQCEIPLGFKPTTPGEFRISKDRRRMTFRFVHQQLKGIVPPLGVVDAKLSFKVNNQRSGVFNSWFYHLDGYYEMARTQPARLGLSHFIQVVAEKIQRLNNDKNLFAGFDAVANNGGSAIAAALNPGVSVGRPTNKKAGGDTFFDSVLPYGFLGNIFAAISKTNTSAAQAAAPSNGSLAVIRGPDGTNIELKGAQVMPIFFSAEEPDVYGPTKLRLTCTLSVVGTVACFMTAGLWEQVPGTPKYAAWKNSLKNIWGNRGNMPTFFNPDDDLIIDLCRPFEQPNQNQKGNPNRSDPAVAQNADSISEIGGDVVKGFIDSKQERTSAAREGLEQAFIYGVSPNNPPPSSIAEALFISYQNDLTYDEASSKVYFKPLPVDLATVLTPPTGDPLNPYETSTFDSTTPIDAPVSDVQTTAGDTYTVTMSGAAVAYNYLPDAPELISIGGVAARRDRRLVKHSVIGNTFAPINKVEWEISYLLARPTGASISNLSQFQNALAMNPMASQSGIR